MLSSVDANKELTHEYADLLDENRERALRKNYGFVCACDECAFASKAREAARAVNYERSATPWRLIKKEEWESAAPRRGRRAAGGFWSAGPPLHGAASPALR